MNKVILTGRLTADPELRYTSGNTAVCKFNLAVDRFMGEGKENQADFISCTAWRKTAEHVSKYYFKGKKALVEGSIKTGSYDAQDGHKVYTTEVWVERVEFADDKKKDGQQSGQAPQQSTGQNDLPPWDSNPADDFPKTNPSTQQPMQPTQQQNTNSTPPPWQR